MGSRPRALDLFCGAGGVSVGLARAGFDIVGVDSNPKCEPYWRKGMEPYGGEFICADALEVLDRRLGHFDLICASPPCQAHTVLRRLNPGREYPDLIPATRERLQASGIPWCIENVPGAPLGGANLTMLCGTMFGLQTPDGRAELRRHRLFETSFSIPLRPACQHGHVSMESLSVCGTGMGPGNRGKEAEMRAKRETLSVIGAKGLPGVSHRRRALSVSGHATEVSPSNWRGERKVLTVVGHAPVDNAGRTISITGATPQRKTSQNYGATVQRETFSTDDARAAMGCPWMPMRFLSQAIPPAYSFWLGKQALAAIGRQP